MVEVPSLLSLCVGTIANTTQTLNNDLKYCHDSLLFEIVMNIHPRRHLTRLSDNIRTKQVVAVLSDFSILRRLLRVGPRRQELHRLLGLAVEQCRTLPLEIAQGFNEAVSHLLRNVDQKQRENNLEQTHRTKIKAINEHDTAIIGQPIDSSPKSSPLPGVGLALVRQHLETGLSLGVLLCDIGCFPVATTVSRACLQLVEKVDRADPEYESYLLEVKCKLLHSLSAYCEFVPADDLASKLSWQVLNSVMPEGVSQLAACYELSSHSYMKSQYQESYVWAMKALKLITTSDRPKLIIDVLRQASKSCVVKRQYSKAKMLVMAALAMAKDLYGTKHAKYADCLLDNSYYLLSVDCVSESVQTYEAALALRIMCFGSLNLMVAGAREDLAYAMYVNEYGSGHFSAAERQAGAALDLYHRLVPMDTMVKTRNQPQMYSSGISHIYILFEIGLQGF
jgi:hypothetical protein